MSAQGKLNKGIDVVIGLLAGAFLLAPTLVFQAGSPDQGRLFNEIAAITVGWTLISMLAAAGALRGRAYLAGGRLSLAGAGLAACMVWIFLSLAWAMQPWTAWSHAFAIATFVLVGAGLKGWVDEDGERRNALFGAVLVWASFQVIVMGLQAMNAPWTAWGQAVQAATWLPGREWLASLILSLAMPDAMHPIMGTLGNPNTMAEALALTLPLLVAWVATWAPGLRRWAGAALVIALGAGLVGAGGRGAILGLFVAMPLAAAFVFGRRMLNLRSHAPKVAAALALVGLILVGGLMSGQLGQKLNRNWLADPAVEARLVNWKVGMALVAEAPLQGTGVGSYKLRNVEMTMALNPEGLLKPAWEERFIWLHNEPLQIAVELGLIGLLLAMATLVLWCRNVAQNATLSPALRFGLLASVGGFLVASAFGFPMHVAAIGTILVVVGVIGLGRPDAETAPLRLHPAYGLVTLALVVGVASISLTKDVWPSAQASGWVYVADQLVEREDLAGAAPVYGLAARHQRYKAPALEMQIQVLLGEDKNEEALALIEASGREGLGFGTGYWKGLALKRLGRTQEATAELERVVRFCGLDSTFGRKANAQLEAIKKAS